MKIDLSVILLILLAGSVLSLLWVQSELAYITVLAVLFVLHFFLINDDLLPHIDDS